MSLFLEDRMKEQIEDPENDKIVFIYPWINSYRPTTWYEEDLFYKLLRTSYHLGTEEWHMKFSVDAIYISLSDIVPIWKGSSCLISYNIYSDNDMRFLFYSSAMVKMEKKSNEFQTPDGFMKKFMEAWKLRRLTIVVHVELHLPLKWFYRPFDHPKHPLGKNMCDEYPADLENDHKFVFLKTGDYSIKCSDGAVPALKMVLNISSTFMIKHFKKSNGNELIVDFSVDVVKPVIYYLHSRCFEMPQLYDLDYAQRLLEVIDYFKPEQRIPIRKAVHQSLCRKFVEKTAYSFHSLLPWLSIACEQSFYDLASMISSLIAGKYYFEWQQVFPENARNDENENFREVFGSDEDFVDGIGSWVFEQIKKIYLASFQCKVILP